MISLVRRMAIRVRSPMPLVGAPRWSPHYGPGHVSSRAWVWNCLCITLTSKPIWQESFQEKRYLVFKRQRRNFHHVFKDFKQKHSSDLEPHAMSLIKLCWTITKTKQNIKVKDTVVIKKKLILLKSIKNICFANS